MELEVEKLDGVGHTLQTLEQSIKDTLAITTSEVRYDVRHKPVRVRFNYHTSYFIISELTLDKDGMILTIDPIF